MEGAGRKKGSKIPVRFAPVKAKIKQELRVLAREYSGQALETLVKICESGESETARVAAANALLDRGYGKPSQHVDLAVSWYESMSESELRAHIEEKYQVPRLLDEGNGNGGTAEHWMLHLKEWQNITSSIVPEDITIDYTLLTGCLIAMSVGADGAQSATRVAVNLPVYGISSLLSVPDALLPRKVPEWWTALRWMPAAIHRASPVAVTLPDQARPPIFPFLIENLYVPSPSVDSQTRASNGPSKYRR